MLSVCLTAFVLSTVIFPFYINWLKRKQIGQYIREEGPQSHAAKAKTPTMGGLCFIAVSTVVSVVALFGYPKLLFAKFEDAVDFSAPSVVSVDASLLPALVVCAVAVCCGLVGFADDFAKVTSKSNSGLSAKARLLIEFALGMLLGALIYFSGQAGQFATDVLHLPASGAFTLFVELFYSFVLTPFLVAATTNALNLHDGMDGLAGGTSIQVFAVLVLLLVASGKLPLAIVAASLVGALGGFLIYNRHKAKVFMGDTGSLFLGGAMAALAAMGGLILWFVPLALIYIVETLSVMIQVVYFKLTKDYRPDPPVSGLRLLWTKLTKRLPGEGKRFFRMAPLHHHFEAVGAERGMAEWQVVAGFWIAQFLICASVVALAGIRL